MRAWLWDAPRWVWCALFGTPVGLVAGGLAWSRSGPGAAVVAGVVGLGYGSVPALRSHARQRDLRRAAAPVPTGRQAEVLRAAVRGPAPADEDVRGAARRVVNHRLAEQRREGSASLVVLSVGAVAFAAGLAWTGSPWLAVVALLLAWAVLEQTVVVPRRLRRQARLLRSDTWD